MDYTLPDILNFAVVAALLVISPGPNGVLIAKTVPQSGKVAGGANTVGFVCAFYLHGMLSIFGISLILTQSQNIFLAIKLAGALYLCYLGLTTLNDIRKPISDAATQVAGYKKRTLATAFSEGFLTNALNPKVSMFYLAAFPQFIPPGGGGLSAWLLVVVHSAINAIWFSLMIFFFGYFNRTNTKPFFRRLMQGITGTALLSFGVVLASTAFV